MPSIEEGGNEYRPEDKQGTHWPVAQEDEEMIERVRLFPDKAIRLERAAAGVPFPLDQNPYRAAQTGATDAQQ